MPVEKMLQWCKGLKVDTKAELIISWNHHEDHQYVSINQLSSSGRLISQHKDLTDPDEKILDVLVFTDYRYFLTATSEGNIYVWKYVTKGKTETARRLIHTFEGHFKAVTSI
jgi:WD40 repeat protein